MTDNNINAVSADEVQLLQEEVATLKKEVAELRRQLNENSYRRLRESNPLTEECFIPNLKPNDDVTVDPSADPLQILAINNEINGISFSNIRKTFITSTQYRLEAECTALDLQLSVACDLSYESDCIRVLSSNTTFKDSSLVAEITNFINTCHREKNLQELLCGIVQYLTLRQLREKVVEYLCNDFPSDLNVNCQVDDGIPTLSISNMQKDDIQMTCKWNINWDSKRHVMRQFITIICDADDLHPNLKKYLKELCDYPCNEMEDMKMAWKKVLDAILN